MFKEKYGIPKTDSDGFFTIIFGISEIATKKMMVTTGFVLKISTHQKIVLIKTLSCSLNRVKTLERLFGSMMEYVG